MKVVEQESQLGEALASAQREALSSFGDARMLVEKYVLKPRHVEIQVFADQHGNCLYLNERDCSIQRRHQKVVEEAPAPGLSEQQRQAMGEAAVRAAQAIGYVGAGTVEFLLDARGEFFFMEMNTRLQVEHPVTEAITGLDLVAWQIRVACGEPLPITQAQVPLNGHAIEVRLYAEDPANDFLPATGDLTLYRESAPGAGRRVDSGVSEGDSISPYYDPMLGKLIAWGENREQARLRLLAMLDEFAIGGLKTNIAFLRRISRTRRLPTPSWIPGSFHAIRRNCCLKPTRYLPSSGKRLPKPSSRVNRWYNAMTTGIRHGPPTAACAWACQRISACTCAAIPKNRLSALTTARPQPLTLRGEQLVHEHNGLRRQHLAIRRGNTLYLQWNGELQAITQLDPIAEADASHSHQGGLGAPMNGSIVRVMVEVGQVVEAGTPLVVLEAMKMEHSIRAPHNGTVKALFCEEGDMVSEGSVLVELEGTDV